MGQITPPDNLNYVNILKPSLNIYANVSLYKQTAKQLDRASNK